MYTIPTLSKSTCARLPLRNAALTGFFLGVFILTMVSGSIYASSLGSMDETIQPFSSQKSHPVSQYAFNSDTLLVVNFNADDRLNIQLGVIHSRLSVLYRLASNRSIKPSSDIDIENGWSILPNSYWKWDPSSGDWWMTNQAKTTVAFPIDLIFVYQRSLVEPVLNQQMIREKIQQQLDLRVAQETEPFQLEQSGRITRGIVTGSNQQISLESGLDIQLTGTIGDETQLSANFNRPKYPIST